jgi:hypothetical protein
MLAAGSLDDEGEPGHVATRWAAAGHEAVEWKLVLAFSY